MLLFIWESKSHVLYQLIGSTKTWIIHFRVTGILIIKLFSLIASECSGCTKMCRGLL